MGELSGGVSGVAKTIPPIKMVFKTPDLHNLSI